MNAMVTYLLLLVLWTPFGMALSNSQNTSKDTELKDVLTEGEWVQTVKLGNKFVIETQAFTFCAGGRVREENVDDTGIHISWGEWALEKSDGGFVLVFSGDLLRYRGRFPITYSEKERAFYLHVGSGDRTWRYEGQRGETPCASPK